MTSIICELQEKYVPYFKHRVMPTDQHWFGPRCREAADAKYRAGVVLKITLRDKIRDYIKLNANKWRRFKSGRPKSGEQT